MNLTTKSEERKADSADNMSEAEFADALIGMIGLGPKAHKRAVRRIVNAKSTGRLRRPGADGLGGWTLGVAMARRVPSVHTPTTATRPRERRTHRSAAQSRAGPDGEDPAPEPPRLGGPRGCAQTARAPTQGFDALIDERIAALMQRNADALARPLLTTQRNVESVVGIDAREFLRVARAGAFASTKERRLVVARTADVVAHFESRMRLPTSQDADSEAHALARVGLRRVGS